MFTKFPFIALRSHGTVVTDDKQFNSSRV